MLTASHLASFALVLLTLATAPFCLAEAKSAKVSASARRPVKRLSADWNHVERKLKEARFDRSFIKALHSSYETKDFKDAVELNTLIFLKKGDYHAPQVTENAVGRVRGFVTDHQAVLLTAEKENGVDPMVVASLLWMESRYGQNLGRFHVASVYAHLLQLDRPSVLQHLKTDGPKRFEVKPNRAEKKKIVARAKRKVEWAMAELKALEEIFKKRGRAPLEFRGSFAGAFGMSQFIPSSYARWAKSAKGKAAPDLNKPEDAIMSVAFYLRENGWGPESRVKALMRYNNSEDYANAILALAEKSDIQSVASAAP